MKNSCYFLQEIVFFYSAPVILRKNHAAEYLYCAQIPFAVTKLEIKQGMIFSTLPFGFDFVFGDSVVKPRFV